jgi:hypothetical protein
MHGAKTTPNLIQTIMVQFLTIHNEPSYQILVKSFISWHYRVLIQVVDNSVMF